MARTNAYVISSTDLMSVETAINAKKAMKHVEKNKTRMIAILFEAMVNIQRMATKHGVSQFEGMPERKVMKHLHRLSVVAYKEYAKLVKTGANLRAQRAFVKMFSKGRNRKAIKAAALKKPAYRFVV
jgi:hypothetical protein